MFKSFFQALFPEAPPSIPASVQATLDTQSAVISALVRHIEADGSTNTTIRVPSFALNGSPAIKLKSTGRSPIIVVMPGQDVFGDNVVVEPAPGRSNHSNPYIRDVLDGIALGTTPYVQNKPTTANTASAAVTADSAAKPE